MKHNDPPNFNQPPAHNAEGPNPNKIRIFGDIELPDGKAKQGTYRDLTADEIGTLVRGARQLAGLDKKQLALHAGVHQHTIERIENGGTVDEDTLRNVAIAAALPDHYFVSSKVYIATEEEKESILRAAMKNSMPAKALDFATEKDALAILNAESFYVNALAVPEKFSGHVQRFINALNREAANNHRMEEAEKQVACRGMLFALRQLETTGYTARYSVFLSEDGIRAAVILLGHMDDNRFHELASLAVPREFEKIRTVASFGKAA